MEQPVLIASLRHFYFGQGHRGEEGPCISREEFGCFNLWVKLREPKQCLEVRFYLEVCFDR